MSGRISIAQAVRLGLIPAENAENAEKLSRGPRKSKPAIVPRRSAKGGRLPVESEAPEFDLSLRMDTPPRTKARPRTQLSKAAILKAFAESRGNYGIFKSKLESIRHTTYTPDETRAFEAEVTMLARAGMRGRTPHPHPVHVDVVFVLEGDAGRWPTDVTDPDIDNMEKAVFDALNGVVWKDDRLVVSKRSLKACTDTPGILIRVRAATTADVEVLLPTPVA